MYTCVTTQPCMHTPTLHTHRVTCLYLRTNLQFTHAPLTCAAVHPQSHMQRAQTRSHACQHTPQCIGDAHAQPRCKSVPCSWSTPYVFLQKILRGFDNLPLTARVQFLPKTRPSAAHHGQDVSAVHRVQTIQDQGALTVLGCRARGCREQQHGGNLGCQRV